GLPIDGHHTRETAKALHAAAPKTPDRERAGATVADVRDAGSGTIRHADYVSLWGSVKLALGGAGAATAGAEQIGIFDAAKAATDQVSGWRDVFNSVGDLGAWVLAHWWFFALIAGVSTLILAKNIRAARLADHRSGRHVGPKGD